MFRVLSVCNKLPNSSNFLTRGRISTSFGRESSTGTGNSVYNFIVESAPTESVKQLLISIHDYSGLPWWATIICTTAAFRTAITFPLAIYQHYIIAKIENLKMLEMPEISEKVKRSVAMKAREYKWTDKKATLMYKMMMKKEWDTLVVRDNCHPFKASLTIWFQLPVWVFLSAALRNASYMLPIKDAAAQVLYLQLAVGGFLWIPNLAQPDEYLILPIILALSNLSIIEIQALRRLQDPTRFQRYATNFFRIFTLLIIPISATVPSAVSLYWTTSSVMGLAQNLLLMSNRLRKFCRIPDTPSTLDHPYQQLAFDVKQKIKTLL
ncbi:mitochondrial inner membrane protein COX18 isoform X2 [Cimex lectularius]|uniref:Membrane insertase YidC/Oxa/ALB C-terminal domain-containing protein n=1 Tax=Cimex lectularius TaxID=79782 RepID=A0A8I6SCY8_CIMLE|nr:mitochondrial inner membrane protein COX18 isoform X2 [Cimex lectularius]